MPVVRSQATGQRIRQRLAKERRRRKRLFQRRLNVEPLELRNLLAGVVDSVEAEALAVPVLFEETPASEVPVEVATWWVDAPVTAANEVKGVKVLDEECAVADDAAFGIEVAAFDDASPVEISLFSAETSFSGETWDAEPMLAEPMLMAFSAVEDGSVEATDEMPMLMAFSAVEDGTAVMTDEMPMRMAFSDVDDGTFEKTDEMPMLMTFGVVEDGVVEKTDATDEGETKEVPGDVTLDGQDDAFLLRTLMTVDGSEFDGSDMPIRMYTMAGPDETTEPLDAETLQAGAGDESEPILLSDLPTDSESAFTAVESAEELMLMTAMGPSPWQNQDDPDDVNVDGWTTARDALLVINRVNDGVLLSLSAALEVTLFVDVNGDRSLDASDAAQVINTLNDADQAPLAAEAASRMAPIWFDSNLEDNAAWEDTVATEEADGTELTDEALVPDAARMIAVPIAEEKDQLDESGEDVEKEETVLDESLLFSADADWLAPELL